MNPKALEEADALDAKFKATGKLSGPLHGITVLVKHNIDVVGMAMTTSFQGWKNYQPTNDPLRTGVVPLYSTRETAGPMARTVRDADTLRSLENDKIFRAAFEKAMGCRQDRRLRHAGVVAARRAQW